MPTPALRDFYHEFLDKSRRLLLSSRRFLLILNSRLVISGFNASISQSRAPRFLATDRARHNNAGRQHFKLSHAQSDTARDYGFQCCRSDIERCCRGLFLSIRADYFTRSRMTTILPDASADDIFMMIIALRVSSAMASRGDRLSILSMHAQFRPLPRARRAAEKHFVGRYLMTHYHEMEASNTLQR